MKMTGRFSTKDIMMSTSGAGGDVVLNVGTHVRPPELITNTQKGSVDTKMATDGMIMIETKYYRN